MISKEHLAQLRELIETILDERGIKKVSSDISEKRRAAARSRWGEKAVSGSRSERIAKARKLGAHTEQEWRALLDVCEWQCVKCGAEGVVKDHIIPIYKGGSDLIENIQPLCQPCNGGKGPSTVDYRPGDWMQRLQNACTQVVEVYTKPVKTPAKRLQKSSGNSAETWDAYKAAYQDRYGVEPVRNAQVNSILAKFVQRVPSEEAPAVARFYVAHNQAFYVRAKHPASFLLRDAEGLRTEWATGRSITDAEAKQVDATAARGNVWGKLIEESREH